MMKANEIRKMSAAELEAKLVELKKDLFMLRMQHATNQLDNPLQIAAVKKDIARIIGKVMGSNYERLDQFGNTHEIMLGGVDQA